ncbi:polysaccharide biosynthesis tyrosine autokinase [Microbacterium sp. 18062]|uniref:polysaccharide biosynthesis tyrosine autokinase n=1 Tax=Microbacterium sp. 18062 TaxID=2681410 RepID=UPI00135B49FF|nr:polysaccharide biosynthesis tyrosine autokinase [Microbacterium sp. 18062]
MELRDYLRVFSRHWVVIVVLTIVGAAAAFAWSAFQPRVYTATTSGYVAATQTADGNSGMSLVGDQLAQAKVTSYLDIGRWRAVAEHAIAELGLNTSPEALVGSVSVTNPNNTVVIHVAADADSPEAARALAEAWVRGMQNQIDQIEGNGTAGSAAVGLIPGDSAQLPSTPSSPNTRLNVALGALVGLALAIGYAVVRHVLDRCVRDRRDVERETGVAVVGVLPVQKELVGARRIYGFGAGRRGADAAPLMEAMRELRTNLQFMDVDNPPRVIVVTSPLPGDGKSTTAANLAASLAASGQPTLLIDADLRRPVVAEILGVLEGAGLSDVLSGRVAFDDVLQRTGPDGALHVLAAGRTPPNPSEILGSQRMRDLLKTLRETYVVIVDSPPAIPVTDAAVLAAAADGALIVASAGKTTFEQAQRAVEILSKANGRALGIVLNRMPQRRGYYGYSAYGGYHNRAERRSRSARMRDRMTRHSPRREAKRAGALSRAASEVPAEESVNVESADAVVRVAADSTARAAQGSAGPDRAAEPESASGVGAVR